MPEHAAPNRPQTVQDRSGGFNVAILVSGVLLALATFVAAFTRPDTGEQVVSRLAVVLFGVSLAVLGFLKWRNEQKYKAQQAGEKLSVVEELQAERLRILTITNGAFQTTAKRLQDLAASDLATRKLNISGFRQSVVEKACDLVLSDNPRSAYFQIEEGGLPGARRMSTQGTVASRGRADEFTTSFEERSGKDSNVWSFVDNSDDADMVLRIPEDVPEGYDLDRPRAYKSYISVPVRAGTMTFGMLTINNLERDGFDEQDKASMRVLSRLLAAAEAICVSATAQNRLARPNQSGEMSPVVGSMQLAEEEPNG